jgi:hypothetical protein
MYSRTNYSLVFLQIKNNFINLKLVKQIVLNFNNIFKNNLFFNIKEYMIKNTDFSFLSKIFFNKL